MWQLQNLDTEVRPYLSRWYEESVMHIYRVVQMVQSNISFLLHAVSLSRTKGVKLRLAGPNLVRSVIIFGHTKSLLKLARHYYTAQAPLYYLILFFLAYRL